MVATCIAEEGLDIAEVDLIISYDMVASPIRMIQRNGRTGRKRDGKVVILITEGKEEEKLCQSMDRMDVMQNSNEIQKLMSQLHFMKKSSQMISEVTDPCIMVEKDLGPQPSSTTTNSSSSSSMTRISELFCDLTVPLHQSRSKNLSTGSNLNDPVKVIDLEETLDDKDLFSWNTFPATSAVKNQQLKISSLFTKAQPRKVIEPKQVLTGTAVDQSSLLQEVNKDCSICGLQFTTNDVATSLCPVCVEMMSIPVSQDDSSPLHVPAPSTPKSSKIPSSAPAACSPSAVSFQISPVSSHFASNDPAPPRSSSKSLYRTLEEVLSSRLNFDMERDEVKEKIQLINSHLTLGCLLQQPSNSSQYRPPFMNSSNPTANDLMRSPSLLSPPVSLKADHEVRMEDITRRCIQRSRYPMEIPSFPRLTSQESGKLPSPFTSHHF